MARPRSPKSLRFPVEVKVSKEHHDFLARLVREGRFASMSEALRWGIDAFYLAEHGQAIIVVDERQVKALHRAAIDYETDPIHVALAGILLMDGIHDSLPQLEAVLREALERLAAPGGVPPRSAAGAPAPPTSGTAP